MKIKGVSVTGYTFLLLFLIVLIHYFYVGIKLVPSPTVEFDSVAYHIPIAKSILSGEFVNPHFDSFFKYFPGSSESILALLILLKIPLGLFNWFAVIFLFIFSNSVFLKLNKNKNLGIIFAFSVCTLNVVLRWISNQTVDIWLTVFFMGALSLLIKPENSLGYYLKLGFFSGMMIGTKYSSLLFLPALLFIYRKNFLKHISFSRLFIYAVPLSIFGFFWYARNYFATGNPFYPMDSFLFKGVSTYPGYFVWQSIIHEPFSVFNALISEYMIWGFLLLLPIVFFSKAFKKIKNYDEVLKLIFLGLVNFAIFLLLPSTQFYQTHVSVFRYGIVVFIPLILAGFLLASTLKVEKIITITSFTSFLMIVSPSYHPKLLFVILPVALLLFARKEMISLKKLFN